MMARKDFVAVRFPSLLLGGGVQHKLDEENFDISNHQKFMRHKMGLKRKGGEGSILAWRMDGR